MNKISNRIRALLLHLALGTNTFRYMVRSIKYDTRTPSSRWVDIVVRKDGVEERIEADWVKNIAKITNHVTPLNYDGSIWVKEINNI